MLNHFYSYALDKAILPIGDRFAGGDFMKWLRLYREEQWLSIEELRALEAERLAKVLEFARDKVPYYKNLPTRKSDPFEEVRQFPVLTKQIIKENLDQLLTLPAKNLIAESSSGSSGLQSTVYMDKSAQASQRAMQMLWFEWSGYRIGDSILQTGMTLDRGVVKAVKDILLKTKYLPAFNLEAEVIERALLDLRKNPRQCLFGYASSLNVLAETAIELNITDVAFKQAVSWGDKLFPHYREKIKRAFGCDTVDTYGCTEGAMVAAQCREGNYHLSINQCYLEVVDDEGNPVRPGELGKVLVTRFDNFAMPLIRYYLGDLVETEEKNDSSCRCGRHLPLLRRIVGRDTDIVKTRSGKRMIVHFFTAIFEHVPQIKQFKVVQKSLDEIEIHYVRENDFVFDVIENVEKKIHHHLGEKLPVKWIETDSIAPTKSGKPQIIQSFLK